MSDDISLNPSAEELAVAELAANRPDLNTRPGTALRRTLIAPFTLMTQPFLRELRLLEQRLSFADIENLSEDDLDRLASNIFATRRQGAQATGSVRLFFREAVTFAIGTTAVFHSKGGVLFSPIAQTTITAGAMRLNSDGDRYYVDIPAIASSPGTDGNVDQGDIITIEDGPTDVVEVTNPAPFVGGLGRETNAQFFARLPIAITTRVIESEPGIQQVIFDNFPQVTTIQPIGFGDPEMDRDILTGQGLMLGGIDYGDVAEVHIGGHTDVYIRTSANIEQTITLINANGDVRPNVILGRPAENDDEVAPDFSVPFLAVTSIQLADPATGVCNDIVLVDGVDYVVEPLIPSLSFSTRSQTRIRFLPEGAYYDTIFEGDGQSIVINYLTNPDVAAVQTFIEQKTIRSLNANVLVKSFAPVFVDVDVTYFAVPPEKLATGQTEATEEAVVSAITQFLAQAENQDGFNIDDLYRILYSLMIERVNKPIGVKTERVDADGTRILQPVVADESTDTEFQIIDRGTLDGLLDSIDLQLATNLGHVGASLGDQITFTWDGGTATREIVDVLRSSPEETALNVVRMDSQTPVVTVPVTYEIRRDTVINVASIPRISAMIPRRIRALRLAI
jgi:hypothetical protein